MGLTKVDTEIGPSRAIFEVAPCPCTTVGVGRGHSALGLPVTGSLQIGLRQVATLTRPYFDGVPWNRETGH